MKLRLATIAATAALAIAGTTLASTASARDQFSVSIGAPGFAVGYSNYSNYGHYGRSYVYAAPPVAYYGAPYYSGYPVVYGPRVVYARPYVYHRPYWRAHYGWR
ncbi:MAG TPA: virulence factor [Casimicrobiaceae bacterium]|jgi:hypothetical protein|nr:virulence factor [Casimicrobiaceae bacterium]